jgi:soluble lytic murein transglycosylase-like protein
MDIVTTILSVAKSVGVSGTLLLALCAHESGGFKQNYAPMDNGSPSFGSCQVKKATADFLGFKGKPQDLMNPKINAYYAAKYLEYQQNRYGNDWIKLVASYNAGTYNPSSRVLGCPRNLKYVKLVQKQLPAELQDRLNCGIREELAGNP